MCIRSFLIFIIDDIWIWQLFADFTPYFTNPKYVHLLLSIVFLEYGLAETIFLLVYNNIIRIRPNVADMMVLELKKIINKEFDLDKKYSVKLYQLSIIIANIICPILYFWSLFLVIPMTIFFVLAYIYIPFQYSLVNLTVIWFLSCVTLIHIANIIITTNFVLFLIIYLKYNFLQIQDNIKMAIKGRKIFNKGKVEMHCN